MIAAATVELECLVVRQWIDEGVPLVLLDIRNEGGAETGALLGCRHIPLQLLPSRLDELPRDCRIVLYCQAGTRSRAAARYLREAGYDAFSVRGGFVQWQDAANLAAAI